MRKHMLFDKKMADNTGLIIYFLGTRQAVLDTYKRSGLTVDDIDCFEIHDCLASSEYVAISFLGLQNQAKSMKTLKMV